MFMCCSFEKLGFSFVDANRDKPKGPGGMGIPQGMPPGAAGMSQPMPDPIGALQNLTVQGIGPVGQQGMYSEILMHLLLSDDIIWTGSLLIGSSWFFCPCLTIMSFVLCYLI